MIFYAFTTPQRRPPSSPRTMDQMSGDGRRDKSGVHTKNSSQVTTQATSPLPAHPRTSSSKLESGSYNHCPKHHPNYQNMRTPCPPYDSEFSLAEYQM